MRRIESASLPLINKAALILTFALNGVSQNVIADGAAQVRIDKNTVKYGDAKVRIDRNRGEVKLSWETGPGTSSHMYLGQNIDDGDVWMGLEGESIRTERIVNRKIVVEYI